MDRTIIIGTRGSDLALWQARFIQQRILDVCGLTTEIRIVTTTGDQNLSDTFEKLEGKGFFTKEIEEALYAKTIDIAVHSLKDVPTEMPPGLVLSAIPVREDARDVLLINERGWDPGMPVLPLARGARVGTSAVRRKSQLLDLRPDLEIKPIRGNLPTRVARANTGDFEATLLAKAGLNRLEFPLDGLHVFDLDPELFVPAPAQGALGLEAREDDTDVASIMEALDDPVVAADVNAERSLLGRFGGGCSLPLGAHIRREGNTRRIYAYWRPAEGVFARRCELTGDDPAALADQAFHELAEAHDLTGLKVAVTRPEDPADRMVSGLRAEGAEVIPFHLLRYQSVDLEKYADWAMRNLGRYQWILFASAHGVRQFWKWKEKYGVETMNGVNVGVVGPATAKVAEELGFTVKIVSPDGTAEGLLEAFRAATIPGDSYTVILPGPVKRTELLPDALGADGHDVMVLDLYETVPVPLDEIDRDTAASADYVMLASPSAARRYAEVAGTEGSARLVSIGPSTTRAATAAGLEVWAEAPRRSVEDMIACLRRD